jgi:hypothetical protein
LRLKSADGEGFGTTGFAAEDLTARLPHATKKASPRPTSPGFFGVESLGHDAKILPTNKNL